MCLYLKCTPEAQVFIATGRLGSYCFVGIKNFFQVVTHFQREGKNGDSEEARCLDMSA